MNEVLIASLFKHSYSELETDILALPVRLGVLGMGNPTNEASHEYTSSVKVTAPLVKRIVSQTHQLPDESPVTSLRQAVKSEKAAELRDTTEKIKEAAPLKTKRILDLTDEKGTSVWLIVLSLRDMGFNLN